MRHACFKMLRRVTSYASSEALLYYHGIVIWNTIQNMQPRPKPKSCKAWGKYPHDTIKIVRREHKA